MKTHFGLSGDMLVRRLSIALAVFIAAIIFQAASLPQAEGTAAKTIFNDDFDGPSINASLWTAQLNTNTSGYPAYGGTIRFAEGSIFFESDGSSFPYVHSIVNPFPSDGDFVLEFDLTYLRISTRGCGLWVTRGEWVIEAPGDQPPDDYAQVFLLFPNLDGGVRVFLFGQELYDTYKNTGKNLFRLEYVGGNYSVYMNDALVASAASQIRPDTIAIGHLPCYYVPLNDGNDFLGQPLYSYAWCNFKIDSIRVETSRNLPTSKISLFTSASSTQIGYSVDLNGKLTNGEDAPISEAQVILAYLIPGVDTWYPITSVTTDIEGSFAATWMPTATGNFAVRAEWKGNENYSSAVDIKNISVFRDSGTNMFYVESNSTLSSLSYNSTANSVSFDVTGPQGTTGYVRFLISRASLGNVRDLTVYIDGLKQDFNATSTDNFWILYLCYSHSTHSIKVAMSQVSNPAVSLWVIPVMVAVFAVFIVTFKAIGEKMRTSINRRL